MNRILEKIRQTVITDPDRTAYCVRDKKIGYGSLWQEAEKYADLLCRQGDSPVLIIGGKEVDVVIAMIACLSAQRAYVPIRSDTPVPRIRSIAELTGATLILSEKEIGIDTADTLRLSQLTRFAQKEKKTQNNRIAYMIFTSGSTGDPKGVPIGVENLENFVGWIGGLYPLCEYRNVTVFNQASFSFDLSVADFYYALCNGHTLCALDDDIGDAPERVFQTLFSADVAVMTPTFARLCLLHEEFCAHEMPRMKCIYFCGECLDVKTVGKLFTAFPSLEIINAYGPTEATSAVSAIRITREMAETLQTLPVGELATAATDISIEDGEIVLRGKSVFGGYLGGNAGGYFNENGVNCYSTGDLGRTEEGLLYCLGRMDRQVKYSGYRIELDDIERNIGRIPGVKECAVVAKKNPEGSVRLIKAFLVTDGTIGENAVRERLGQLIPAYMTPKSIRIVERLPVNENGKTDRKVLESW